jgi:hypothetical protein
VEGVRELDYHHARVWVWPGAYCHVDLLQTEDKGDWIGLEGYLSILSCVVEKNLLKRPEV